MTVATWLITGCGSGLGRALAHLVLDRGDAVVGTFRTAAAADVFSNLTAHAHGVVADMRDAASVEAAVRFAEALPGGLTVLVNNAGYGLIGAVEEASLDEARAQFEVNVLAPLCAIGAALPGMRARRAGAIVNVTSVSGLAAWAGTGVYCASKFALEALGETLAQEVGPLGVRVVNAAPGGMRTDYAGRSALRAARRIQDYAATAHVSERLLADHVGSEPNDPALVAAAIVAAVTAPTAPLHLLLGADALHYALGKAAALQSDIAENVATSIGVGFPIAEALGHG